jgi:hypothetical protein
MMGFSQEQRTPIKKTSNTTTPKKSNLKKTLDSCNKENHKDVRTSASKKMRFEPPRSQ